MKSIEITAKSVDEAVFRGLQQLEISIDEVSIEIIQTETKGILGIGAKPAIVRLTQKPPEEYELPDYLKEHERREDRRNQRREERRPSRRDAVQKAAPAADTAPAEPELHREEAPTEKRARAPQPRRNERAPRSNPPKREPKPEPATEQSAAELPAAERFAAEASAPEAPAAQEELVYTEEAAAGIPAAEFVTGVLEHMGVESKVLAAQDDCALRLRVVSENMGMLIGHRGETLDALQYLTSLVANRDRKSAGYTRITLDTENYRKKREDTLRRLAKRVAAQVKATGRPRVLEPMNPYERRILHAALQNNPYVTTHSEGEEPNRRVVVTLRRRQRRSE